MPLREPVFESEELEAVYRNLLTSVRQDAKLLPVLFDWLEDQNLLVPFLAAVLHPEGVLHDFLDSVDVLIERINFHAKKEKEETTV